MTTPCIPTMKAVGPKPFLKWAGGKRQLLPTILPALPADFDLSVHRFFEPFTWALATDRASSKLLAPLVYVLVNRLFAAGNYGRPALRALGRRGQQLGKLPTISYPSFRAATARVCANSNTPSR